jgi:hypothetical protein
VVRVCCRFHFVACCFFMERPFVNFKRYLSPGRFIFFSNLIISKIRSRRPNRVRPFCFFPLTFSNGSRPAFFFLFNLTSDYCIRDLCCLLIFGPFKVVFIYHYLTLRLVLFYSIIVQCCALFCLFYHCLMLRFVLPDFLSV